MAIFKNFRCPNGLPPDECRHVQQIVINLSNYFIKRNEQKRIHANSKQNQPNNEITTSPKGEDGNRTRVRAR